MSRDAADTDRGPRLLVAVTMTLGVVCMVCACLFA
jgi:hypothetical protein